MSFQDWQRWAMAYFLEPWRLRCFQREVLHLLPVCAHWCNGTWHPALSAMTTVSEVWERGGRREFLGQPNPRTWWDLNANESSEDREVFQDRRNPHNVKQREDDRVNGEIPFWPGPRDWSPRSLEPPWSPQNSVVIVAARLTCTSLKGTINLTCPMAWQE